MRNALLIAFAGLTAVLCFFTGWHTGQAEPWVTRGMALLAFAYALIVEHRVDKLKADADFLLEMTNRGLAGLLVRTEQLEAKKKDRP